jgi:hypothetical protein
MSKQCSNCQLFLPREDWTDRQWSKKFAPKCKKCLEPKHATQKAVISGDGSICASCGDPCQLFKGLCRFCELNKHDDCWHAAQRVQRAKKLEQARLKYKVLQAEQEENGIILRMPEGTQRIYTEDGVRYGLVD